MAEEKPIIYVALDYNTQGENLDFARRLAGAVDSEQYGFKINLDHVASFFPDAMSAHDIVKALVDTGRHVMVDMKMWNGGRTMANIAQGCGQLGVDIVNMYPHGGGKFISKVKKALEDTPTKLFGLTVLTHYTDEDTMALYGKNVRDATVMLAQMGYDHGVDGIILPGTQLDAVANLDTEKLVPGIRPVWFGDQKANDQEQIVTPTQAVQGGARYLVAGSPIRKSKDQAEALEKLIAEVNAA